MAAIPRYRRQSGPALLSAGFRPFFLFGALWAAIAIPIWLMAFAGEYQIATASSCLWAIRLSISTLSASPQRLNLVTGSASPRCLCSSA